VWHILVLIETSHVTWDTSIRRTSSGLRSSYWAWYASLPGAGGTYGTSNTCIPRSCWLCPVGTLFCTFFKSSLGCNGTTCTCDAPHRIPFSITKRPDGTVDTRATRHAVVSTRFTDCANGRSFRRGCTGATWCTSGPYSFCGTNRPCWTGCALITTPFAVCTGFTYVTNSRSLL
jgi:hypothetical protein